ncbi:hypothetical protein C1H46_040220 [Malus baccata]|uniref:Uncharacterized protein n=1 Tax=Malus baccata TaxID=106549 RepID=A0A540KJ48_MALBA|nr:hypothetical protein C1H46_040220 [Malus baccata]
MQEDAFWSLLEQNWAWNGYHMLGAKGMNEIEDLKKKGFLISEGVLLGVGKLSQGFLFWFDLSSILIVPMFQQL